MAYARRSSRKIGISRQTISKWELDETLPIYQSKKLAVLYHMSLDELIEFDVQITEIQEAIEHTSEEITKKVDWTKAWGKKYPILTTYQKDVDIDFYAIKIKELLKHLKDQYGYTSLNALLVLKDILSHVWNDK